MQRRTYLSVLGVAVSGLLTGCSGDEGRAREATEVHNSSMGPATNVSTTNLPPNSTTVTVDGVPPTLEPTTNSSTVTVDSAPPTLTSTANSSTVTEDKQSRRR